MKDCYFPPHSNMLKKIETNCVYFNCNYSHLSSP